MHICITRSEKFAYSETFIRDQITWLSKHSEVYPIHSSRFPEREENGTLLSPKPFWVLHKIVKGIVGRNNFFSNYGVSRFLKKNRIDVVLANYGMSAAHMVPVCKETNVPLLVIFHGHDATNKKTLKKYRTKYLSLFDYASAIIVVSKEMKKGIIKAGADPSKIHVIPCGVNVEKFSLESRDKQNKNFLAVGRFAQKKGPLLTIEAFSKVLKEFPDAKLTMVGKKDGLYAECVSLVEQLGITAQVEFTGVLDQNAISGRMKNALAFVQHSVTAPNGDMEGTPVSIMEASSSGLPIISTLHGGIKDAVIHNKTGFLVEENNVNGMAEYMLQLCREPNQAKLMGLNARKHIEVNYNQSIQLRKIYDLLKKTVQ